MATRKTKPEAAGYSPAEPEADCQLWRQLVTGAQHLGMI